MKIFDYINNSDLYLHVNGNTYKNIRTGKEGDVDENKAKNIFTINQQASILLSEYPTLIELIKVLNLKMDS